MSQDFIIATAGRKIKRDINKTLGNDLKKYLTELLTNSDDSYTRLEKKGLANETDVKPIEINISERTGIISVVDNAEGMNLEELKEKFLVYGADTSAGQDATTVRGMFGQGATDVLMSAAADNKDAIIISIKDGICTECHFHLDPADDQKKIRFPDQPITIDEARKQYRIPGNGTAVVFGLPSSVRMDSKHLAERLQDFYMLRFLFSKPNRHVTLRNTDTNKEETICYDGSYYDSLPVLEEAEFTIEYKGDKIKGNIELRQNKEKQNLDKGIFVCDDKMVAYDEQFFERKSHSGMEQIEGKIVLYGLYDLVRAYLNADQPEEIIKDDRDGFNTKHDFYHLLKVEVAKYIIRATGKVEESKRNNTPRLKDDKKFAQALKMINQFLKEELEEIAPVPGDDTLKVPPAEGIRFIRSKIKISKGKQYSIKMLINTTLLPGGSIIDIDVDQPDKLKLNKTRLMVPYDVAENPTLLDLAISGKETTSQTVAITAESGAYQTALFVDVIDIPIHYPKYGLEFFPRRLSKKPEIGSKGHLYVDARKYPLGTQVNLKSESIFLSVTTEQVILSSEHMVSEDIAVIDVIVQGGEDSDKGIIAAKAISYTTRLEVIVSEKEEPDFNKGGMISDIECKSTQPFVQTYYDADKGLIVINDKNQININMLEEYFKTGEIESVTVRNFIADLASTECAKLMMRKKIEGGKITIGGYDEYYDGLQKDKLEIYKIFCKVL